MTFLFTALPSFFCVCAPSSTSFPFDLHSYPFLPFTLHTAFLILMFYSNNVSVQTATGQIVEDKNIVICSEPIFSAFLLLSPMDLQKQLWYAIQKALFFFTLSLHCISVHLSLSPSSMHDSAHSMTFLHNII